MNRFSISTFAPPFVFLRGLTSFPSRKYAELHQSSYTNRTSDVLSSFEHLLQHFAAYVAPPKRKLLLESDTVVTATADHFVRRHDKLVRGRRCAAAALERRLYVRLSE
jgi:hypothetical protein